MIYFDHNATTPLAPAARDAWVQASAQFIGNPSSPHRLGAPADAALTNAREQLAALLGCHALELVWTSGATESNNTSPARSRRTRNSGFPPSNIPACARPPSSISANACA